MKIFAFFYFLLLKLRYSFEVVGIENIKQKQQYIVLPNHQALVDPQIVGAVLWQKIRLTTVVSETFYNLPIFKLFFKMIWAVLMGDIQRGTSWKKEVDAAFQGIDNWIQQGKNILLYPSWQLYSQGYEVIKWKKSAFLAVQHAPKDLEILVVKVTWLWWSQWSKARNGDTPNFLRSYVKSILMIFANLIFFVPKRKVKVVIENYSQSLKKAQNINEFNQLLQDFYNTDGIEKVEYQKHFFYFNDVIGKQFPKIIGNLEDIAQIDESTIPHEVSEAIKQKIASMKQITPESIQISSNLIIDLYFDSLDMAEIKSSIQITFPHASNPPVTDLKTHGDLCYMAIGKSTSQEILKPCEWQDHRETQTLHEIISNKVKHLGKEVNILSLLKASFRTQRQDSFVYDDNFWLQSKKDFLIKAYLIASYIKKIEGKYIGIMLPAVSSASVVIVATYLAGKVPVMLNWTLGEISLLHCVKFAKIDFVLTSRVFYDRVKNDGTDTIKDMYLYLEDMLKEVPLIAKLKALVESYFFLIPTVWTQDEAVMLFTSGSESLPKAVSLTHKNIISDILGALYHFPVSSKDVLVGFLPPFHSFWFTINTIMPLISGLKVAYTPSPNDSKTIINIIKHTKTSVVTVTPTFLKMILQVSTPNDLASLKYAVVGAEKCPESLWENFSKYCPNAHLLEWYGITECSPVISINPPQKSKLGSVWLPVYGSEIKIISLENQSVLGPHLEGMIYFSWDNVFSGYLDEQLEHPFAYLEERVWEDGKQKMVDEGGKQSSDILSRYYKTWDLGYVDEEGYLYITWRLKRFVKIAWEMISLPFIESILNTKYGWDTQTKIAVEAREEKWTVKIVLFAIENLDGEEVSTYLRESWVSNLVKISEIIKLDEIPVLGTGKTDYKQLKEMIHLEESV